MKLEIGSYGHIYNRGNRKQEIVRDAKDRWHFLQALYYLNHQGFSVANPSRELRGLLKSDINNRLVWPEELGKRKPLVKILCFKLMRNHLHLCVKQEVENGISLFMQRVGITVAKRFNERYQEVGSLFQGRYKGKLVDSDEYLMYLSVYIQVKNAFEEFPGGLKAALQDFDNAYDWVAKDPYSSLGDYAGDRKSPIIEKDILGPMFPTPESYREFAKQCMLDINLEDKLGRLRIDE